MSMEDTTAEQTIVQLLDLLVTTPALQKQLVENFDVAIQRMAVPVPLDAAKAFLTGLELRSCAIHDTCASCPWRIVDGECCWITYYGDYC